MKKVLFSAVMASSLLVVSCGPSFCDCVEQNLELMGEAIEAAGDEEKTKELEEKAKALEADCKKYEDMSDEDKKKEMEACMSDEDKKEDKEGEEK